LIFSALQVTSVEPEKEKQWGKEEKELRGYWKLIVHLLNNVSEWPSPCEAPVIKK